MKGIRPRHFPRASRFKSSVAFCYRVKKQTVAGHPRLKFKEPMAEATLLIVDGNPLQDVRALSSVSAVFMKGERVNRTALFQEK